MGRLLAFVLVVFLASSTALFAAPDAKGPRGPRGFRGATGPIGPAGPIGPTGPAGTQGQAGKDSPPNRMTKAIAIVNQCAYPGPADCLVGQATASCPAGYYAMSGGYYVTTLNNVVLFSRQTDDGTGWEVQSVNYDTTPSRLVASVVCLSGVTFG